MRTLHAWMFIAATILLGLAAGLSANASIKQITVINHTDGAATHFGVMPDQQVVVINCSTQLLRSVTKGHMVWSADIVFPDEDYSLKLTDYKRSSVGIVAGGNRYRQMNDKDAKDFCEDPRGQYEIEVNSTSAKITEKIPLKVQPVRISN